MDFFDRYPKRYDTWYDKNPVAYHSEIEVLRKALPARGKGLEVGVGTGRFAAPLHIDVGVDISLGMIRLARQRGVDARLGWGEKLDFKNSMFDYVTLIVTLCFVHDPEKVIEEARRVLKKNGMLVVGIVDKDSFLGQAYQKKRSAFYKNAHFFNPKEVRALLQDVGFNKFSYFQTLFTFPDKMVRVDEPLRGFGQGGFVVIKSKKA